MPRYSAFSWTLTLHLVLPATLAVRTISFDCKPVLKRGWEDTLILGRLEKARCIKAKSSAGK